MKRTLGILATLIVASSPVIAQPIPNAIASSTAVANVNDVLWDNEHPDKPIPAEFLKSRP